MAVTAPPLNDRPIPVVLVRNKCDTDDGAPADVTSNTEGSEGKPVLVSECWKIMEKFNEIVTCVECSAKQVA